MIVSTKNNKKLVNFALLLTSTIVSLRRRILVLGDSMTEGYEVRQNATFAKVLEHRLRDKGIDAQVLNTGVSGFGNAEELMFLEHEGMKYRIALTREQLTTEYAVRVAEVNDYEQELAVALLNRVKMVAHTAHVPFVIVDIPSLDPSAPEGWASSVPDSLVPSFRAACDIYLTASAYMGGVHGVSHVPHGHHHITEQTHEQIAKALEIALMKKISKFE
jgi:hypothetical protein